MKQPELKPAPASSSSRTSSSPAPPRASPAKQPSLARRVVGGLLRWLAILSALMGWLAVALAVLVGCAVRMWLSCVSMHCMHA